MIKNKLNIKSFDELSKLLNSFIYPADVHEAYSLKRIETLLKKLDNPQDKIKVVHIAGTSGKTSTAYFVAELLKQNGYHVGLSVSPHIEQLNERVQINSVPLPEKVFCENITEYLNILTTFDIKPTYFELFVSFAYWYFAKINVDYAVVEVGLGGLLDATNTISRVDKICVITDIGLDHISVLGSSLPEIAFQKAGIIKNKNIVFVNQQADEIMDIFSSTAKQKNATLNILKSVDEGFDLPLIQRRNWTLSRMVVDYIFQVDSRDELSKTKLVSASKIIIPGRLEKYLIKDKEIILDGAHNHQKMEALILSLKDKLDDKKVCVVLAVGQNKKDSLLQITRLVSDTASKIIITSFDTSQDLPHKSLHPGYIGEYFPDMDVEQIFSAEEAIQHALESSEKIILVTGSLYLVSQVRKILREQTK